MNRFKNFKYLFIIVLGVFLIQGCSREIEIRTLSLIVPKLTASKTFALKIVLTWDEIADADGYFIYRAKWDGRTDPNTLVYEKIDDTKIPTTSYSDAKVGSLEKYYYKIQAYSTIYNLTGPISLPALGETRAITVDEAFSELGDATGGKRYNASGASDVPKVIVEIIKNNAPPNSDIVFLIDNTGSMGDDINAVKSALKDIITSLPSGVQLGMSTYNDLNYTSSWFTYTDLTTDFNKIRSYLDAITVYGGGDTPESVYEGIYETATKMTWKSTSKRIIIVIGDAAPQEGSRALYTYAQVIEKCNSKGVSANLFPILIK